MHSKSVTLQQKDSQDAATNLSVALCQDALTKCMLDNAAMGVLFSFGVNR